jgi:hypothetical protein
MTDFDNILREVKRLGGTPKNEFFESKNMIQTFSAQIVWNPRKFFTVENEAADIWWLRFTPEIRSEERLIFAQSNNGAEAYFFLLNDDAPENPFVYSFSTDLDEKPHQIGKLADFLTALEAEETK